MVAMSSMAAGDSEAVRQGERSLTIVLALFLGVVQIGWLGLLLWVIHQIASVI